MASGLASGSYCLRHRQVEGLLQHVLARHRRMHRVVRKADPGAAGRKGDGLLRRLALVGLVGLHAVVQLQHQVVVFAAQLLVTRSECSSFACQRRIRLGLRQEAPRHVLERLADAPDARLRPAG